MSFTVAIVGRPNVGKSTLFNRLVGRRLALVDDRPGVTRDRREGEARLGDLEFTVIDTAGLEEAAPESLVRPHAGADRDRDRAGRRDVLHDRCARRPAAGRPRLRRAGAQIRQADRVWSPTRAKARPARPGGWKPTRSASAIRSRFRPSTAKACPISTRRCARRCPRETAAAAQAAAEPSAAHADPRRHRRPSECRQVHAGQPADRRGAAADRAGSRHHARRHRRRSRLARIANSSSTTPPACAAARASRRSWRSCRSPTRSTPSASPKCGGAARCRRAPSRSRTSASPIWSSRKAARSSSRSTNGI